MNDNIDGLVHKNDLSWTDSNGDRTLKKYQKGQSIQVKILEIDPATQTWKYISLPSTMSDGQVVDSAFWFPTTILGADGAIYGIPYFQDYGSAGQNGGLMIINDPLYWQPPAASLPAPWTLLNNQQGSY